MKETAVIILNWNGAGLLEKYLPSIVRFTPSDIADVIVADNGSSDDSISLLEREFPDVKILKFDRNHGFAEGYNRAIASTRYRYTVLLNSDVEVKNDWLTPLYRYITSHSSVVALQPKIKSINHPDCFEYAGASGGFLDRNGYPYCRGRLFDTVERDRGQYDQPMEVMWASGAALMVDTERYIQAGGLDTSFFAHMEEIDLCWRMQLAGGIVAVEPASEVYHLGGASLDASNPRKTYLNYRNSLLMLYKNLPGGKEKVLLLLRRRLLDTVSMMMLLAKGRPKHALAVIRAHLDYLKMRHRIDRAPVEPAINLLKSASHGRRNIIVDYFLKGKKTFDQLVD